MKKSEIITHITLGLIIIAAFVAIALQVINEKTNPLETTYEIITFTVAITALSIAVLQGLENARSSRELDYIAREIRASLRELKSIDRENEEIIDELEAEVDMDKHILEILEQHSFGDDDTRNHVAKKISEHIKKQRR